MGNDTKAKIYLSDERGLQDGEKHRSYHTFNFGNYFNEFKVPFLNLLVLNDDTLAGNHSVNMEIGESAYVILLPVVGAIYYKDSLGHGSMINAGELQIVNLPANENLQLSNPYENDAVNFLQIQIKSGTITTGIDPLLFNFDLVNNNNSLIELRNMAASSFPICSIGQFSGREEAVYIMKNNLHGLFVFIIEGAFEVQGRLLHPRDGLALWDVDSPIELEALSNEAIVLLLEL